MHSSLAFLHLHFFTQPFSHLQETSSWQILDASGSVVERASYTSLVLIQPQSVGDGKCWCRNQGLTSDMSAPAYYSLDVRLYGCTCWWDQLDIAFLCKLLETCLVEIGCGACSVIKQYDKPLSGVHGIFMNMSGAVAR